MTSPSVGSPHRPFHDYCPAPRTQILVKKKHHDEKLVKFGRIFCNGTMAQSLFNKLRTSKNYNDVFMYIV